MKLSALSVVLVLVVSGFGCQFSDVTMNEQRAFLRSTGDSGVTVSLDELVSDANAQGRVAKLKEVVQKVEEFFNDGQLVFLNQTELRLKLQQLIPGYAGFVSQILAVLSTQTVDVEKGIGGRNLRRMKAFVKGTKRGLDEYKLEDRREVDRQTRKMRRIK